MTGSSLVEPKERCLSMVPQKGSFFVLLFLMAPKAQHCLHCLLFRDSLRYITLLKLSYLADLYVLVDTYVLSLLS